MLYSQWGQLDSEVGVETFFFDQAWAIRCGERAVVANIQTEIWSYLRINGYFLPND